MAVYRVSVGLTWTGPGSPGANVWHLRTEEEGSPLGNEQLQDAIDELHAFYSGLNTTTGGVAGIFAPGTRFNLESVTNVESDEGAAPTWVEIVSASTDGDLPPICQICVSWKTTSHTRRGSGRTFLGPLNAGVQANDGSISGAHRQRILDAATLLATHNGVDDGWAIGVYGLVAPGGTPLSPHVLRDIIGATVGTQFASLRSRRD